MLYPSFAHLRIGPTGHRRGLGRSNHRSHRQRSRIHQRPSCQHRNHLQATDVCSQYLIIWRLVSNSSGDDRYSDRPVSRLVGWDGTVRTEAASLHRGGNLHSDLDVLSKVTFRVDLVNSLEAGIVSGR